MANFENAIALTGGIATGKSSVCSLLNLYGFQIIDADKVAHQMLSKNVDKISDIFGNEYIKEGRVDRKKLGNLIFNDLAYRQKLEKLLHPLIKEEILKQSILCESKEIPYIIDIPLFYEKNNYNIDEVIVVYCDKYKQINRLIDREGYDIEDAQSRIDAQMPIEVKKEKASFVIDNTKDLKFLQNQVEIFIKYIKNKYPHLKI